MQFISSEDIDERTRWTASDALTCKYSACLLKYIEDPFVKLLFEKLKFSLAATRKPPIINRGYFTRIESINSIIESFLSRTTGMPKQIISLGSGYDTLCYNLANLGDENLKIFDIDFPLIVRRKAELQLLQLAHSDRSARLSIIAEEEEELGPDSMGTVCKVDQISPDGSCLAWYEGSITYIGVDLRDAGILRRALVEYGTDFNAPTLIITECVLVYMEKTHSQSLCCELSTSFSEAIWVTYDMIGPDDAFGRTMTRNLQAARLNVPGFKDFPTLEHQERRFLENGWQTARSCTMLQAYANMISGDEKKRIAALEIFDEIEEWELIMSHYALTVAAKGSALLDVVDVLPPRR